MKTIVYIDGYNLYYSLLRHTPYKWLNLFVLFENHILKSQNPERQLLEIKYYTANIKAKFATHGQKSDQAQNSYHRALATTGRVKIIKGSHSTGRANPYKYINPPDLSQKVEAWKIEEKETDVNIALDIYRDAVRKSADQVVLCSNDSDLTRALEYVQKDCPTTIGLVAPFPKGDESKQVSGSLSKYAHWKRSYILDEELEAAQFKARVPTAKKPIDKPDHW